MNAFGGEHPGPVLARALEIMRTQRVPRTEALRRAQAEQEHAITQASLFDATANEPADEDATANDAPSWQGDPFAWCLWYLHENAHIYRAFREAADALFERHPTARTSAETIIQHLRYMTPATAIGDPYKVNNNARSLFARLYIAERPHRREQFERRRSYLDSLEPEQKWTLVRAAREGGTP